MFKEAPEVLRTDLKKVVGEPREIEKNIKDTSYFDKKFDLKITQIEMSEPIKMAAEEEEKVITKTEE